MKRFLRILLSAVMLICVMTSCSWATQIIIPLSASGVIPPNAYVGEFYTATFMAKGGKPPYSWDFKGTLPPGLYLDGMGSVASVKGVPTKAGMYDFWAVVYDSSAQKATSRVHGNLIVYDPANIAPSPNKTSLKDGVPGKSYSDEVSSKTGQTPLIWEIISGTLPPTIKFESTGDKAKFSGILSDDIERTYAFSLKVTDDNGRTGEQQMTFKVAYPLMSLYGSLKDGVPNEEYSASFFAVNGILPCTWEIISGKLPLGITLSTSGNQATLSGKPLSEGTYPFTLKVTDAKGRTEQKALALKIYYPPLSLSASVQDGTPNQEYSATFSALNGVLPCKWEIISGDLPSGITLSSSGREARLSGKHSWEGKYPFTLKVTDAAGRTEQKELTLNICYSPLTLSGSVYWNYAFFTDCGKFTVENGFAPYVWRISEGFIPPGLSLDVTGNGENGARIIGRPSLPGTYKFTLAVTDSKGRTAEKDFSFNIVFGIIGEMYITKDFPEIKLYQPELRKYWKYQVYHGSVQVEGGQPPYRWSLAAGKIPLGLELTFSSDEAKIDGWVSDQAYEKNEFILKVIDADGRTMIKKFSITAPEGLPGGSSPSYSIPVINGDFAEATEGKSYSSTISVTGGTAPYTWTVINEAIPDGLTLKVSDSGTDVHLTGTPKRGGEYASFKLKVMDFDGNTDIKLFTVKVNGDPDLNGGVRINSVTFPDKVFRDYVLEKCDTNGDGILTPKEAASVTKFELFIEGKKIADLKGIEFFTALTELWCDANQLTVLDVSRNTALTKLYCHNNKLTALDVSGNTALTDLSCDGNQLTSLNVSKNTALISLYCYSNKLTSLNVSKNTALAELWCDDNQLTALDVSKNTGLYSLWCPKNQLTALDLSKNAALTILDCSNNKLTSLDVTNCHKDISVMCDKGVNVAYNVISTKTIPDAIKGVSYTSQLKGKGKATPYTWTVSGGKLPDGLKLEESTGKITGKSTKAGTFAFTVQLKDSKGRTSTKDFTMTVTQTALSGTIPTTGIVKASYTGTLKATGGTSAYTWTISKGALPDGLKINASTGKITGTPTKAGTFNFTVKVTDKNSVSATKAFTVKVTQTTLTLTVPATIIRGQSYTWTPKASGGTSAYKWTISNGKLPDGLSINSSTGKITGKPTKAGTFNFTVKVTDKNSVSATKAFTVKVTQTTLTLTVPATIIRGQSYTWTPKASGGTSAYTWAISKGALPDGLKINASTGKITGKPTKAGTFSFTVKVTDKNSVSATKAFTVKVTQTTLNLTVSATIIRGKSYTWTPKVSGGTSAYKWSISKGKLPDGLSINASTGKITGKPSKAGTFNFTVKVMDKNNIAATKAFTVKVTQTTLNLTVPTTIIRGKSYTWTPKVTGGTSAYTWTISKGSLPTGMKINASTGKITGKPTKTGKFSFTVKVKDKNNIAATKVFTVKVTESASTTAQTLQTKNSAQLETGTSSINSLKSSPPETLQTEELTGVQGNGAINLAATLNVSSDDVVEAYEGKDSDLVKVKAGKDLTFIVGDWGVDVSNVTVYVNENALEGITLEDNKFTLPSEIVHDDFKVSVKAQSESGKLESEEVYVISE